MPNLFHWLSEMDVTATQESVLLNNKKTEF